MTCFYFYNHYAVILFLVQASSSRHQSGVPRLVQFAKVALSFVIEVSVRLDCIILFALVWHSLYKLCKSTPWYGDVG